jgi:triosephosphate isomerase
MNPGTGEAARALFLSIRRAAKAARRVSVAVCPPAPFLPLLSRLANTSVILGAQDVFWRNGGAHTGEVSPEILKSIGATFVLVGHSERRAKGETDEGVARKVGAVVREGLTAVVCVGEKVRDENGDFFSLLYAQIKASLSRLQRRFLSDIVLAYEPVWAIGKNWREAPSPEIVREAVLFVRKTLVDLFGTEGSAVPILYGGSVGPENIAGFLKEADASGFLIGHESLDESDMSLLIRLAHESLA